jgi:hypothetical protein
MATGVPPTAGGEQREPLKVLYLLARGRTGSTIVARVLGEVPGFFSVGEIRSLWDPVALRGGRCACGRALGDCPVWGPVLSLAEVSDAAALQREVVRERNLPRLLRASAERPPSWPALERYARLMGGVYGAVARAQGARVVVDSSKRPSYGAFLRLVPDVRPFYVHLVRDPRASAFSWKRRRYESIRPGEEVTRRGAADATIRWDVLNLEAEALRRAAPPGRFMRMRLEDFVAAPRGWLAALLRHVGEPASHAPFAGERSVRLGPSHAIGGNPAGLTTGTVAIQDSSEWRHAQTRADRLVASALALPLARRYGYALGGRRGRAEPERGHRRERP